MNNYINTDGRKIELSTQIKIHGPFSEVCMGNINSGIIHHVSFADDAKNKNPIGARTVNTNNIHNMNNYINIDGKIIELSKETLEELKKKLLPVSTPSEEVAMGTYKLMGDINWETKEEVLVDDKKDRQIYVNKKFAHGSKFGSSCIFIKCKFGSSCTFGSECEFGSYCEFGSNCKKQTPYWDENGKHE